ncbi:MULTISPECIES: hypothetical protein [unclassified Devosia]|uniref:hypothetical protein n=1 Tax=unclassified Devosia TaxID=196773 RepID=UPI001551B34F|nr:MULTISPECIES: hypothetical protein [unclassified Devosia]
MTQTLLRPPELTAADYREQFPDITVGLNWERFAAERWPIERRTLTNRQELLGFHTFFRKSLGRIMPHFLHWLASQQMRMGDVVENFARIPAEHRASVEYFVAQWASSPGPLQLELPTYRFAPSEHFILDGNHRATAIALSGKPFRIELVSVVGPRERDALVDVASCR